MRVRVFRVRGMRCGGCAEAVETALSSIDGVDRVSVSLESGRVTVVYDPGRVRLVDIVRSVERLGFKVEL